MIELFNVLASLVPSNLFLSVCFPYFLTFRNTTTPTSCWTDKISGNDVGKLHQFFLCSLSIRIFVFSYIRAATPFFNKKIKDISSCQLSKPIKGGEAHELGLVDALASPNDLVNTARQWALDIYELRRPWIKSLSGLRERFRDIK